MQLVFVHGMSQEGLDAIRLRATWENALRTAWQQKGRELPAYNLVMPYFGEALAGATAGIGHAVAHRGAEDPRSTEFELAYLEEMAAVFAVSFKELPKDNEEQTERGVGDWRLAVAAARMLESRIPSLGRLGLGWVRQVDAYLNVPAIREAIEGFFIPVLSAGPSVVVAHSLGTIVAYSVLRALGCRAKVPLLVTLGSPLGMRTVQDRLTPPSLTYPAGVSRWINGADVRDPVALYPRLESHAFGGLIENLDGIQNRFPDPHSIEDYISHPDISAAVHAALSRG